MSVVVEPTAIPLPYHPSRLSAMVVAEDPRVRAAMTRQLWVLGARDVVEAASAAEARRRAGRPRDLCVVDVHLPDGSGVALLAEMRRAGWTSGLALSATDDCHAVRTAFSSGVRSYVVVGGRRGPAGRMPLRRDSNGVPVSGHEAPGVSRQGLSEREIEVLRLVAEGQSNKAIAKRMGLSALTVKSHLARIARKLGTGDRAGMVAMAMRGGIIT